MRNSRLIGRIIALVAITVAAAVIVVLLVGSGGSSHTYKAVFQNGSQLVKGNLIQVAGTPVGKVSSISLTSDGEAQVNFKVSGTFAPLHQGTQAVIRQASLSGIANRYIDLQLPPGNAPKLDDGAIIDAAHTSSAVDLDQLFNVFGPKERKALSSLIQGFANTYAGESKNANVGFLYLSPTLASSARLFSELDRDRNVLNRFISTNARFVTDVAAKQDQLAGLVNNLATTTQAIGRQKTALADAVANLPPFMRRANSTFVNLRTTLDALRPLVDESKPVAKKLRPFLAQLRPLARDAKPTIHDLSVLISRRGPNNDLIDLTNSGLPVRDAAIGPVNANGASRQGAFPETVTALQGATPELAFTRPYAVDLTGWASDFSTPGIYDALGAASRAAPYVNAFAAVSGVLQPVPPSLRAQTFNAQVALHQNDRCPGGAERTYYNPPAGFECDPKQVPPGP